MSKAPRESLVQFQPPVINQGSSDLKSKTKTSSNIDSKSNIDGTKHII
jgi:hypothetical protein